MLLLPLLPLREPRLALLLLTPILLLQLLQLHQLLLLQLLVEALQVLPLPPNLYFTMQVCTTLRYNFPHNVVQGTKQLPQSSVHLCRLQQLPPQRLHSVLLQFRAPYLAICNQATLLALALVVLHFISALVLLGLLLWFQFLRDYLFYTEFLQFLPRANTGQVVVCHLSCLLTRLIYFRAK